MYRGMVQWRLSRTPALDGIRAIGVVLVIGFHARVSGFEAGAYGVDMFFTLSGFLITSILIGELDAGVDLRRFWKRRASRLLPALFAVVIACVAFGAVLSPTTRDGVVPSLFYFTNWFRAFGGDAGALGHTWSLAIEEQFYLVWPLVLIGLHRLDRSLRVALWATVALAVGSASARAVVVASGADMQRWYNDSTLRADAILIGCAVALHFARNGVPGWLRTPRLATLVAVVLVAILVRSWIAGDAPGAWGSVERTTIAGLTAALIGVAAAGVSLPALEHPVAGWIGVRSYGLYLWHYPIMRNTEIPIASADVLWAVALTFGITALSYRYVEAPFLRWKDTGSWRRVADDHDSGTAIAAVVGTGTGATTTAASVRSPVGSGGGAFAAVPAAASATTSGR